MEIARTRKRPRLTWDAAPPEREAGRFETAPAARGAASPPWRDDDREGHYVFDLGENLTPRYKILSKMGEGAVNALNSFCPVFVYHSFRVLQGVKIAGTFGRVLECWDRETREYVAIKVVRSIRKYRDAAMMEIDVLNRLGRYDRYESHCVQIRRWFDYRNHICIVWAGVILVIFGALVASLLSYARGKHCFRHMKTWSI